MKKVISHVQIDYFLFSQYLPETWSGDEEIENKEERSLKTLEVELYLIV